MESQSARRILSRARSSSPAAEDLDARWVEQRALEALAHSERSSGGLRALLEHRLEQCCSNSDVSVSEASAAREAIPNVVDALIAQGVLDDERFARSRLGRLRRRGASTARIEQDLQRAGVPPDVVRDLLREAPGGSDPELEERRAAWRLARRRRLGPYCGEGQERSSTRERQLGVLGRQGFSRELAESVVDADTDPFAEPECAPSRTAADFLGAAASVTRSASARDRPNGSEPH